MAGSHEGEGWRISWPTQDAGLHGRRKRSTSVRKGAAAPSFREQDIAASARRGRPGPPFSVEALEDMAVMIEVDDASFRAPIYANLFDDTNGEIGHQQTQTSGE